ncbi:MAG TPA: DUF4331 domain-containing protein [Planctomycetota bacterium]|nr:DUF4331 domain-containing protein [Planctomycetota bacterium]
MKLALRAGAVSLPVLFFALGASKLKASSHAEAPAIAKDPTVDNTDVWAWKDTPNTIVVLTGWNPLRVPHGGPVYSEWANDALYEIKIDTNNDGVEDLTYQFQFQDVFKKGGSFLRITSAAGGYASPKSADDPVQNFRQTYSVTKVTGPARSGHETVVGTGFPVAPPNVGPKFTPNYEDIAASSTSTTGAPRTTSDGCKVFVGSRQESFFIDLGAAFDKLTVRDLDTRGNVGNKGGGVNSLAGFNIDVIAIQIPIANLGLANPGAANTSVGVWSCSSRRKVVVLKENGQGTVESGKWVQVSRLGNPLMNELFIPLELKDQWNASPPTADLDPNGPFQKYFLDPEPAKLLHALYNINVPPAPRKDLAILLPDTLKVRTDINPLKPSDPAFFGNAEGPLLGRTIADDVVDIYLEAAAGILVSGYNVFPNNALGDGVDFASSGIRFFTDPAQSNAAVFPYMGTPYAGMDGFDGDNPNPTGTEAYVGGASGTSGGAGTGFTTGRTTTFMKPNPRR